MVMIVGESGNMNGITGIGGITRGAGWGVNKSGGGELMSIDDDMVS